jgi:hypothetical protein
MSLTNWLSDTADRVRDDGFDGVVESGYELYLGGLRRALSLTYDPEYIWDRDWDVLLILDACRRDLMLEVADDYDYLGEVGSFTSPASSTTGWSLANFDDQFAAEMANTGYVTGNPNSVNVARFEFPDTCGCGDAVDPDYYDAHHTGTYDCAACGRTVEGEQVHPFAVFEEMWRQEWDNDVGTMHPEPLIARAIEMARSGDVDRLIVHFNQPHQPFVSGAFGKGSRIEGEGETREKRSRDIWERLRRGEVDRDAVWRAYRENLVYVLDRLPLLLDNVDADRVAVSSDHGNALGEYGVYGHPRATTPIDELVKVPWCVTTARNTENRDPEDIAARDVQSEVDVRQRLADLGYVE